MATIGDIGELWDDLQVKNRRVLLQKAGLDTKYSVRSWDDVPGSYHPELVKTFNKPDFSFDELPRDLHHLDKVKQKLQLREAQDKYREKLFR